jgi:hypothetical protein
MSGQRWQGTSSCCVHEHHRLSRSRPCESQVLPLQEAMSGMRWQDRSACCGRVHHRPCRSRSCESSALPRQAGVSQRFQGRSACCGLRDCRSSKSAWFERVDSLVLLVFVCVCAFSRNTSFKFRDKGPRSGSRSSRSTGPQGREYKKNFVCLCIYVFSFKLLTLVLFCIIVLA